MLSNSKNMILFVVYFSAFELGDCPAEARRGTRADLYRPGRYSRRPVQTGAILAPTCTDRGDTRADLYRPGRYSRRPVQTGAILAPTCTDRGDTRADLYGP